MSLDSGWHGCRYEIFKVHESGMIGEAYIYARKANKITQVARFEPGEGAGGRYRVEDLDTETVGGDYFADTLRDVMRVAGEREAARLLAKGAGLAGRTPRSKARLT